VSAGDEPIRGVVASAAPANVEEAVRAIDAAPDEAAWFELRADRLGGEDVARCVTRAARRTIVTVRRPEDGGSFRGSEEERKAILAGALAAGADAIDVEENRGLAAWAATLPPPRVILSHHGAPCLPAALDSLASRMEAHPAARLKIVPAVARPAEGGALRDLLARRAGREGRLAAFGTGAAGFPSRVFALAWGSWATYGAVDGSRPTGEGQPSARDLLSVYRVREIGEGTRRFGLAGRPVLASPSPRLHAAAYREAGLDAVLVPVEARGLEDVLALGDPGGPFAFRGFGVTIPFKEEAARVSPRRDPFVEACGAAHTLRWDREGARAFNTDGPAARDLAARVLDPRGSTVAILGAGGTARAAALAFRRAGSRVVLFNRTAARAAEAAASLGVEWEERQRLRGTRWDILVQATPLGREGEDALPEGGFPGRVVVDAAYGSRPTPLAERARSAGLSVFDGYDFLAAQAVEQFRLLTGVSVSAGTFAAAMERFRGASP
jgi:shikimate dehydrogenase